MYQSFHSITKKIFYLLFLHNRIAELSMHSRKYHMEPSMHFWRDYTYCFSCKTLGTNLYSSYSVSIHRQFQERTSVRMHLFYGLCDAPSYCHPSEKKKKQIGHMCICWSGQRFACCIYYFRFSTIWRQKLTAAYAQCSDMMLSFRNVLWPFRGVLHKNNKQRKKFLKKPHDLKLCIRKQDYALHTVAIFMLKPTRNII